MPGLKQKTPLYFKSTELCLNTPTPPLHPLPILSKSQQYVLESSSCGPRLPRRSQNLIVERTQGQRSELSAWEDCAIMANKKHSRSSGFVKSHRRACFGLWNARAAHVKAAFSIARSGLRRAWSALCAVFTWDSILSLFWNRQVLIWCFDISKFWYNESILNEIFGS